MMKFYRQSLSRLLLLMGLMFLVTGVKALPFRVVAEPYYDIVLLAQKLKTSRYNPFENPTGIFFKKGEQVKVNVGPMQDRKLELVIVDFSRPEEGGKKEETSCYPLQEGENSFIAKNQGLAYLPYYVEDYLEAPKVVCTFYSGRMNGVFDPARHSNEDWKKMLEHTVFDVIDIKGKYVNLAFDVKSLKENCPDNGVGMIRMYDQIILWEQELMGIDQFGYRTNNHMFGRISWSGLPNANGKGVSFPNIRKIVTPESIKQSNWVIGHEFGHVNQIRPGLKWHGTTEITTNIYAAWVQYKLNPEGPLRIEHSKGPDGTGEKVIGGLFNWHFNHCVVGGKPLLYNPTTPFKAPWSDNKNPFVRLCPFWQLQVYNVLAGMGRPDFYAQMSERVRKTNEKGLSPGELQINFVKNCCDVMQKDMTFFFIHCGMLRPVDGEIGDYGGNRPMVITREMIDKVIQYASKYPQPESPVSYYITANSMNAFKNRAAVEGKRGKGIKITGEKCEISHKVWKNVVVFEAYAGKELKCVTMVGTGTVDNSATIARVPEGCDRLMAVGWDGKRLEVCHL